MSTINQYPINGIQPASGENPGVRMELRDLRKDSPDQFNLYMLGLQLFQTSKEFPEDHPLSYYQIAGIHGEPYQPWPLEPWNKPKIGRSDAGYCTHSSILFLTWHRPFLALFEMQLYKHVQDAAKSYKDPALRERYIKAAQSFRMPYWDWARTDLPIFPDEALVDPQVPISIKDPNTGKDVQLKSDPQTPYPLRNPLLAFPFRGGSMDFELQRFRTPATFRTHLGSEPDEDGRRRLNGNIPGKGRNITERVTYILDSYNKFKPMSSNGLPEQPPSRFENYGSVEDIHNAVHGYIGGHMGQIRYSGFDPIFWLHHTNIDRIFSLWQVLQGGDGKGDLWVTPTATRGNYTNPPTGDTGPKEDGDTPLAPFYLTKEKLYTSGETRTTAPLGYVYPETKHWELPFDADSVRDKLRVLYPEGNLIRITRRVASATKAARVMQADLAAKAEMHAQVKAEHMTTAQFVEVAAGAAPAPPPIALPKRHVEDLVADNKYLEWLVLLEGQKHALNGDYMVHVFLGAPDDSAPDRYLEAPNHVAAFVPLGQAPNTGCEKCIREQDAGLKVTGQIPLNIALVERYLAGQVDSLRPDDVVAYLKVNLHWRVTLVDGERRSRGEVDGLLVAVGSNEVTLPDDPNGRRTFSPEIVTWPEATMNRDRQGRGQGTGFTGEVTGNV